MEPVSAKDTTIRQLIDAYLSGDEEAKTISSRCTPIDLWQSVDDMVLSCLDGKVKPTKSVCFSFSFLSCNVLTDGPIGQRYGKALSTHPIGLQRLDVEARCRHGIAQSEETKQTLYAPLASLCSAQGAGERKLRSTITLISLFLLRTVTGCFVRIDSRSHLRRGVAANRQACAACRLLLFLLSSRYGTGCHAI